MLSRAATWRRLSPSRQAGYSTLELVVALAVGMTLMATAIPSIGPWINNAQIRTVSESLQNGLQLARAEAVRRNTFVSFYLTDALTNTCNLSTASGNWVVALTNPTNACANSAVAIQGYSIKEGGNKTTVNAIANTVTFNGLGRAVTGANDICVGITGVSALSCVAAEPEHQLMVRVSPGGQIRLCNAARPVGDPQRC